MSTEYLVFDKSGFSERIILLNVTDFSMSRSENDAFELQGSGFKEVMGLGFDVLENIKLSRGLSIPLLENEFSSGSFSSEVAGSMADDGDKKQQHDDDDVGLADDEEISSCYSVEDGDEVDALLNLGDGLFDTGDSLEVSDQRRQRIEETFKMLRDLVGGDWMDTVDVLDEAIGRVKKLQMELKNLNHSCDI